jgi:hypothetical protein
MGGLSSISPRLPLPGSTLSRAFFAKLKHGVFRSLQELKDAIHRFIDHTNANPRPFYLD